MHYGNIKKTDIADGEGVRVTLFVSGCRNCCEGCFNPDTWDFNFGKEFTSETEKELMDALAEPYISGLTLLGGEPFEKENQRALVPFVEKVRKAFPEKDIWCYTGYVLEKDLVPEDGASHCEVTEKFLSMIDILVDGPFVLSLKSIQLKFRGSKNQRIIHLKDGKPFFIEKEE